MHFSMDTFCTNFTFAGTQPEIIKSLMDSSKPASNKGDRCIFSI